ncbi:hypothetical protein [Hymenobacter actinosclerus]|uniref:YD repeat-containing protein n=1 Tax=Hymenobacter actinosclerus TaxID=82805 RepID=A0A1I0HZH3_9BACT|nr:hypothetical protein [Hymenobacter actinosclerus]SET88649.1 hypothetical protein SAMN04487998_3007 [Hymenobacter actinosclerus]
MQRFSLLLSTAALTLLLGACSQTDQPAATTVETAETPAERAADLPPGTTIKGEDGSKIKKQADGDIKIKDADGNKIKRDADDGTVKVK